MEKKGKTEIITGGASGLGAATAPKLADDGVKVGIFDINEKAREAIAKELGGICTQSRPSWKS